MDRNSHTLGIILKSGQVRMGCMYSKLSSVQVILELFYITNPSIRIAAKL